MKYNFYSLLSNVLKNDTFVIKNWQCCIWNNEGWKYVAIMNMRMEITVWDLAYKLITWFKCY